MTPFYCPFNFIVYQMGRLCRGAHEISGIKAQIFLRGWVGVVGWVVVGWMGRVGVVGWVGVGGGGVAVGRGGVVGWVGMVEWVEVGGGG